jgi:hypothetical protein
MLVVSAISYAKPDKGLTSHLHCTADMCVVLNDLLQAVPKEPSS